MTTLPSTLILAFDNEDKGTPQSIFLFVCKHQEGIDIKTALGTAFRRWYSTADGQAYVDQDGNNWGDATNVPDDFLKEQGIIAYYSAEGTNGDGQASLNVKFDDKLVVDHNESLFDIGEADDEDENQDKAEVLLCGQCGHYHFLGWTGDCRDDAHRFTTDDLDAKFGKDGWDCVIDEEEGDGEDEAPLTDEAFCSVCECRVQAVRSAANIEFGTLSHHADSSGDTCPGSGQATGRIESHE